MSCLSSCCDVTGRWAGAVLVLGLSTSVVVTAPTFAAEPLATSRTAQWSVEVDNDRTAIEPGEHITYTVTVRDGAGSGMLSIDGVLDTGMVVDAMGVTCTAIGPARCGTAIDGGAGSRSWRYVGADLSAPRAQLIVTVPVVISESIAAHGRVSTLDHRVSVSRADLAQVARASDRDRLVGGPPTFALRASQAVLWLIGAALIGFFGAAWVTRRQRSA
ncbi:MAG: hypothetical protein AAGE94_13745, partial [Acidobacteriota bacterium]